MHTPNHIHDIFMGRQKLLSDPKENVSKITMKIRTLSPNNLPNSSKENHVPYTKEEDISSNRERIFHNHVIIF